MLFLDASALVKAYVEEDGTEAVRTAMRRLDGFLIINPVVAVEVLNTFRRKLNRGSLSEPDFKAARAAFLTAHPAFRHRPIDESVVRKAFGLTASHARKSVGGVDVIHLATALSVKDQLPAGFRLSFATADNDLLALAKSSGMPTFDPVSDPIAALPRRPR